MKNSFLIIFLVLIQYAQFSKAQTASAFDCAIEQNLINRYFEKLPLTIDSNLFFNNFEKMFFSDWLEMNTFFNSVFVSREDFESKAEILVKTATGTTPEAKLYGYNFFLPVDMKISDIPRIVKRVNKAAFGDSLPEYASSVELKNKMREAISFLYFTRKNVDDEKTNKLIDFLIDFYEKEFGSNDLTVIIKLQTFTELEKRYGSRKNPTIADSVAVYLANDFYLHFYESIFEYGSRLLIASDSLDTKINIKGLREDLEKTRKSGNIKSIAKKEREIIQAIADGVFSAHQWDLENKFEVWESSSPAYIIRNRKNMCVGFSLLLHQLLSEVAIKHHAASSEGHSFAIAYTCDDARYLLNIKSANKVDSLISPPVNNGVIDRYYINDQLKNFHEFPAERLLISQMISNRYSNKDSSDNVCIRKVYFYKKALLFVPVESFIYFYLIMDYTYLCDFDNAYRSIEKAMVLRPKDDMLWFLKIKLFNRFGIESEESRKALEIDLKLNLDNLDEYDAQLAKCRKKKRK